MSVRAGASRYFIGNKAKLNRNGETMHAGAQAVVGVVEAPLEEGEGQRKSKDQPHAKQISHPPQPPMWGSIKEGKPVPELRALNQAPIKSHVPPQSTLAILRRSIY